MPINLKPITYRVDDLSMTGWLADGSAGKKVPGILVAHEAPGVGDLVKDRALKLAELGYMAFALDMYGRSEFSPEHAMAWHTELISAPGAMLRRACAALDVLAARSEVDHERMACIGFCQGGMTAMELARAGAPIKAAVGFHPGLIRPTGSQSGPISAKVLMLVGNDDPVAPLEDRRSFAEEMEAAGADWQMHVYGNTGHSYTSPEVDAIGIPGFAYNASADRRSWAAMLSLLAEVFD
jgi:dienelactone hydrolase